jgi:hypothetical protein
MFFVLIKIFKMNFGIEDSTLLINGHPWLYLLMHFPIDFLTHFPDQNETSAKPRVTASKKYN